MSETPDLTLWMLLHQAMRESGDQLAAAVATLEVDDRDRARALHRWFTGFDGELHHHHMVEDDIFFPALAARVPAYDAESGDEIVADHERLDQLLAELRTTLGQLAGPDGTALALGTAQAASAELATLLHRHLALEDDDVLPMFARHFTAEEFQPMQDQAGKSMKMGQARFTVAWLMTHLDAEQQQILFDDAPGILKLVWKLTRTRYDRLAAVALGEGVLVA